MPKFRFLLTRDTTESVVCTVEAATIEEARHKALHPYAYGIRDEDILELGDDGYPNWQPDDCISAPYVADPDDFEILED